MLRTEESDEIAQSATFLLCSLTLFITAVLFHLTESIMLRVEKRCAQVFDNGHRQLWWWEEDLGHMVRQEQEEEYSRQNSKLHFKSYFCLRKLVIGGQNKLFV